MRCRVLACAVCFALSACSSQPNNSFDPSDSNGGGNGAGGATTASGPTSTTSGGSNSTSSSSTTGSSGSSNTAGGTGSSSGSAGSSGSITSTTLTGDVSFTPVGAVVEAWAVGGDNQVGFVELRASSVPLACNEPAGDAGSEVHSSVVMTIGEPSDPNPHPVEESGGFNLATLYFIENADGGPLPDGGTAIAVLAFFQAVDGGLEVDSFAYEAPPDGGLPDDASFSISGRFDVGLLLDDGGTVPLQGTFSLDHGVWGAASLCPQP